MSKLARTLQPANIKRFVVKRAKKLSAAMWAEDCGVVRHNGVLWLLNRRNRVDRNVICGGFEKEQAAFLFGNMGKRGCDCFLDIGANFGLYALQAAQAGLAAEIHAFEPDPRNLAQLQANLYLNRMTSAVRVHREALSDRPGDVVFEIYPESSTGQSRISAAASGGTHEKITVPAVTLDSKIPLRGRRIFIKMDVEGHEREVLKGAEELLRGNLCFLQVEAWPEQAEALKATMAALGYACVHNLYEDYYFTNMPAGDA